MFGNWLLWLIESVLEVVELEGLALHGCEGQLLVGEAVLAEFGVAGSEVDELQSLTIDKLLRSEAVFTELWVASFLEINKNK